LLEVINKKTQYKWYWLHLFAFIWSYLNLEEMINWNFIRRNSKTLKHSYFNKIKSYQQTHNPCWYYCTPTNRTINFKPKSIIHYSYSISWILKYFLPTIFIESIFHWDLQSNQWLLQSEKSVEFQIHWLNSKKPFISNFPSEFEEL